VLEVLAGQFFIANTGSDFGANQQRDFGLFLRAIAAILAKFAVPEQLQCAVRPRESLAPRGGTP
jgi:hypothetical protein